MLLFFLVYDFNKAKRTKRQVMDDRHIASYGECMKQLKRNQSAYDRVHNKEVFDVDEIIQRYKSHRKANKQRKMFLKKVNTR